MTNYVKHTLKGQVVWSVIKDGVVLRSSLSPFPNLILNQGLDFVASYSFADCFNYCAAGNVGNRPLKTDTSLGNELTRTNTLLVAAEAHGSVLNGNIYKMFRTFRFPTESFETTYREVGFSPMEQGGSNLFSKALLRDSLGIPISVVVGVGEALTIRYELEIEINDSSKEISRGIVSKEGSSGILKIQKVGLKGINAETGVTQDFDDALSCNEPSIRASIFISTEGSPPELLGESIDRTNTSYSKDGAFSKYISSSYTRNKGVLFKPGEVLSVLRSVGVGPTNAQGVVFVFNGDQHKEGNKAYLVNFSYTWVKYNPSNFIYWLDSEDTNYHFSRFNKLNSHTYFAL